MVSNDGSIKLADFGASKRVEALNAESDDGMELTMRGTPYFMAPEVFEEKYGSKADIWSVGGVIYQMVTGSPPWKGLGLKSPIALFMHLKGHDRFPTLQKMKSCGNLDRRLLEDILSRCFQRDPSMRPSAFTLQNDAFLNRNNTPVPESPPNPTIQLPAKSRSPKPTLKSPLNKIPEGEALLKEDMDVTSPCALSPTLADSLCYSLQKEDMDAVSPCALSPTLADSLCYSLTLQSPLQKLNLPEETDQSGWPAWAKNSEKENAAIVEVGKACKGVNPFAKKTPLANTDVNIR